MIHSVLSISRADPRGAASVQTDLQTCASMSAHGVGVVTAIHVGSQDHVLPTDIIQTQILTALQDIPPQAIKIGWLGSASTIQVVAQALSDYQGPIVLDPTLLDHLGRPRLDDAAKAAMIEQLFPLATVLVTNTLEATHFMGDEAPQAWARRNRQPVLLGDGPGDSDPIIDRLYLRDGHAHEWEHRRVHTRNLRGARGTLATALAVRLTHDPSLVVSTHHALTLLAELITRSSDHTLGQGDGPLLYCVQ